jgi:tryptophan synthase alpha chain
MITGAERIAAAFAAAPGRAALMPYLMGGFPTVEGSLAVGEAYAENGADLVELGVPFSDPLADGPVIHAAGTRALAAGATVHAVLEAGARIAERVPVVAMCYANPMVARGVERFIGELADRGISGLIVPDLPLEESETVLAACDAAGVALVPLVAPTTPPARLEAIGRGARGFVYTVAVTGTTGERTGTSDQAALLARVKAATAVPVALGFGISTPEQAAAAADAGADGVIVGSRLVRAVQEGGPAAAGPLVALIAGLVVWILGWALGMKSFDAFLITILIVLVAASGRILAVFLPGHRAGEDELGETPYR